MLLYGLTHGGGEYAFLYVGLQNAEGRFVALDRQLECAEQTLGRIVVDDQSLGHLQGLLGSAEGLRIETEVNDQFLRRAVDAAEIGVGRDHVVIFHFHALRRLGLAGLGLGGRVPWACWTDPRTSTYTK